MSGQCTNESINIQQVNRCLIIFEQFGEEQSQDVSNANDLRRATTTGTRVDEPPEQFGETQSQNIPVIGQSIKEGTLPVDVCISNIPVGITPANFEKRIGEFITPISATYTFQGKVSFDRLSDILKSKSMSSKVDPNSHSRANFKQLVFDIFFDNNPTDNTAVSLVDSSFFSSVYSNLAPFNDKTAGFSLSKIWTECKFTPIIKTTTRFQESSNVEQSDSKIDPITLGKNEKTPNPPKKVRLPDSQNDFKFQGPGGQGLEAEVPQPMLNPPFVMCNNKFAQAQERNFTTPSSGNTPGNIDLFDTLINDQNVISQYLIRTAVKDSDINKIISKERGSATISLQITIDTIDKDKAVIADNNNRDVKVSMIVNPKTENVKVIELPLMEITTNCIDVSYSTDLAQNDF